MKVFVILAVVCLILQTMASPFELSEEQKAKAKEYFAKCFKEVLVSEADAVRLHNRDFDNPSVHMKCFNACFFEKVGIYKDGQLQEDVVSQKLGALIGEEKAKAAMDKCKDIVGEGNCDTSYKMFKCFEDFNVDLLA